MAGNESGWMIEATDKEITLLVESGYMEGYGPAWWNGIDDAIMTSDRRSYSHNPNDGIRFCRRADAENVIIGWGYSLDNPWVKVTEHSFGNTKDDSDSLAYKIVRPSYGLQGIIEDYPDIDSYDRIKAERDYYYMLHKMYIEMAWKTIREEDKCQ